MSVPAAKRKQAKSAFVQKMVELQKLTQERTATTPARYREMVNGPLWDCMSRAYLSVLHANETRPKDEESTARRNGYLKEALAAIQDAQAPLWCFWDIREYDDRRMDYWTGKINEEIALIAGAGKIKDFGFVKAINREKVKEIRFLQVMSELHQYTYQKIAHAPQQYFDYVSKEIIDCADRAWVAVLMADEKPPETAEEADRRAGYLREAVDRLNMMQAPMFALWNVEEYSERVMNEWAGLLDEELRLLSGVLRSDKKRYAGFYKKTA